MPCYALSVTVWHVAAGSMLAGWLPWPTTWKERHRSTSMSLPWMPGWASRCNILEAARLGNKRPGRHSLSCRVDRLPSMCPPEGPAAPGKRGPHAQTALASAHIAGRCSDWKVGVILEVNNCISHWAARTSKLKQTQAEPPRGCSLPARSCSQARAMMRSLDRASSSLRRLPCRLEASGSSSETQAPPEREGTRPIHAKGTHPTSGLPCQAAQLDRATSQAEVTIAHNI